MNTTLPPLMTVSDLADYLQVAPGTIYNWRSAGVGPKALNLHGYPRWRVAEVDAWLEAGSDAGA